MNNSDSTAYDGAPCHICGEDAVQIIAVADGSRMTDRALCDACLTVEITRCPGCDTTIWQKDGTRIMGKELFCAGCIRTQPTVVGELAAQLAADEARDDFEQRRR